MNAVICVTTIQTLAKTLPCFSVCVKDVRMLKIEENNDLIPAVKVYYKIIAHNFFKLECVDDENNSKNVVAQNYNELLEKFENLIKVIIAKINIGKQNSQNNT